MFQFENSIHLLLVGIAGLCTVLQLSESLSVQIKVTFYKAKTSWNTASNVCRANGGRLVTLDNQLKIDMVERFKTNDWNSVVNGDFWIGLFDASIGSGTYTWSDCTPLDDSVTNWDRGEPNDRDTDHCVRNTKHGGYWRTRGCNKAYQFICEKILGNCASNGEDCFIARTNTTDIPKYLRNDSNTPHGCSAFGHMSSSYLPAPVPSTGNDLYTPTSILPVITSESRLITSFDPGISQTPPLHTTTSPNTWHTPTPTSSLISPDNRSESLLITSFDPGMSQTPPLHTTTSPNTWHTSTPISSFISPATRSESLLRTSFDPDMSQNPPLHAATSRNTWHTSTPISFLPLYRTPGENQCSVEPSSYTDVTISKTVTPSSRTPEENSETATQHPNNKSGCCSSQKKTVTAEESYAFTSKIAKDLEVQKDTLSSYKRKRISASDDRLIARVEGYIGIVTLAVIFGGIFILDLPLLSSHFRMMLHHIRDP